MEMYALNLGEDGRVRSATYAKYAPESAPKVEELPEGDLYEYRYVNGVFVHDPLPKEEEEEAEPLEVQVAELREALDLLLSGVTE